MELIFLNKGSVMVTLNDCFAEKGNFAYLHLSNGATLLIDKKPAFRSEIMVIEVENNINNKVITEFVHLPYNIVSYITVSNVENLRVMEEVNTFHNPVTLEDLEDIS